MKKSVAMCTYNGEKYIVLQLDSILNQTIKPDEIIICDDCSTDETVEILSKYKNKYPNLIKVIKNNENLGYIKNFEKAINLTTGDFIFLSDQDDIWHENKVETLINIFKKKQNISYIFTDAEAINEKNESLNYNIWSTVNFDKKKQDSFNTGNQINLLINNFFVTGATLVFKSEAKNFLLPFPEIISHDYWIALTFGSIKPKSGYCYAKPLLKYRIHKKQTIGLPKSSVFNTEVNSKLKVVFKSHYHYYNNRVNYLSTLIKKLDEKELQNSDYYLIKNFIEYNKLRNKMYEVNRKESLALIKKIYKKRYYKKFAYSKTFVVFRDLVEKVILNRKENTLLSKNNL